MFCHVCALKMLFCFDMLLAWLPYSKLTSSPALSAWLLVYSAARLYRTGRRVDTSIHTAYSAGKLATRSLKSGPESHLATLLSCTCRSIYLTNAFGVCLLHACYLNCYIICGWLGLGNMGTTSHSLVGLVAQLNFNRIVWGCLPNYSCFAAFF